MRELSFIVDGYPPAKNEARSLLAAGHTYSGRVGLELVLSGPVPPPSDATNYLGGVGDVLEAKPGAARSSTSVISPRSRST